jgi:F-type H+-transporting ATPase subunit epsilon
MNLEIITPDNAIFKGEVQSVKVPGTKGQFTILHLHAPIISTLEKGVVYIRTADNNEKSFAIRSGLVEVKKDRIIILAERTNEK